MSSGTSRQPPHSADRDEQLDVDSGATNGHRARQVLDAVFENSLDAILLADDAGQFVDANSAACDLLGYPLEELLALGIPDITPDLKRADALDRWQSFIDAGRAEGHFTTLRKDGLVRETEFRARAGILPGLHLSVLRDVTDRVAIEESLAAIQQRQDFLMRLSDALRRTSDPVEVQATAARLLGEHLRLCRTGYAETEPDYETITVTHDYTDGVPGIEGRYRYDDFGPLLELFLAGETVVRNDIANDPSLKQEERDAHAALHLAATVNVPLIRDDRLLGVLFAHRDRPHQWSDDEVALIEAVAERTWEAVERARAEASLKESEERFRTLADNMSQLAWIADAEGWIFWYNRRWFDYTGTSLEEMQGWGWQKVHHPDHVDRVVKKISHSFATGEPWEDTFPLRGSDGEYRWFLSRAVPVRDEAGRVLRWFGTNTDVTDQIRVEEAVRASEHRFRLMANAVPQIVWITDSDGRAEFFNRQWTEYTGRRYEPTTAAEVAATLVHPDDAAVTMQRFEEARRTETTFLVEHRIRRHDGAYRWFLVRAEPYHDPESGKVTHWYGASVDIHDRKVSEETLRESRERLTLALEAGRLGDWFLDLATGEAVTSRRHDQCFGAAESFEEWGYDTFMGYVHPDDRDFVQERFDQALELHGEWHFECRVVWNDGSVHWIDTHGKVHLDAQGEPRSMLGVVQDITERKQSEVELHSRSEQLATLVNQAPLGIFLVDSDLHIVQVNPVAKPRLGNLSDLEGRRFESLMTTMWGEDRATEILGLFRHTLESGESVRVPEFASIRRDTGLTEYYDWRVDRIRLPDGRHGVVCYFLDISEQVRTREKIARSEARYRSLFDSIDEGFAVVEMIFEDDRPVDYRFIEVNPAFERHAGLVDASGKTARTLMPDLEEHWFETYGRVARTGQPERFVNFAAVHDGRWFDVYAFRSEGMPPDRVALLFADITSEKLAQEQLEELTHTLEQRVQDRTAKMRELAARLTMAEQEERRRISRILHDDLQQLLFAVRLRLNGVAREIGARDPESISGDLDQLTQWLDKGIGATRQLSVELSPPILKNEGLADAFDWLARHMQEKYDLQVEMALDRSVDVPDEDLRTLIFTSVQELLFNVVKHAGVRHATLATSPADGRAQVEVRDEGAGFDMNAAATNGGFGLAHLSERLRLVGGHVEIHSAPGRGTRVTIMLPPPSPE